MNHSNSAFSAHPVIFFFKKKKKNREKFIGNIAKVGGGINEMGLKLILLPFYPPPWWFKCIYIHTQTQNSVCLYISYKDMI